MWESVLIPPLVSETLHMLCRSYTNLCSNSVTRMWFFSMFPGPVFGTTKRHDFIPQQDVPPLTAMAALLLFKECNANVSLHPVSSRQMLSHYVNSWLQLRCGRWCCNVCTRAEEEDPVVGSKMGEAVWCGQGEASISGRSAAWLVAREGWVVL